MRLPGIFESRLPSEGGVYRVRIAGRVAAKLPVPALPDCYFLAFWGERGFALRKNTADKNGPPRVIIPYFPYSL